jgi:hypothetical protein
MVEGHPVGAAGAPVVADDGEPVEPQRPHHLDLVAGDRAHAVGRMVERARRGAAVAEAPQVGGDHGEPGGELGGHPMPHQVGLGYPVQQQDRRPLAAPAPTDRRPGRGDVERLETVEPLHQRSSASSNRRPAAL